MDSKALKFIFDIQQACAAAEDFCTGITKEQFESNDLLQAAVERKLEIIGEAVNQARKIDSALGNSITTPDRIVALRNILVHYYWKVAPDILWDIVQVHVPALRKQVENIIKDNPPVV